ncbi:Ornithine decarboxylase [Toxocara canis]|uniref:ornithine decarboxylase n=1 Tax=Toxocara canis TaxID=6265 RepID=A0A0B2VYY7_TOXCA|nr:Ornithine decarboxylase [Toxocara canis]
MTLVHDSIAVAVPLHQKGTYDAATIEEDHFSKAQNLNANSSCHKEALFRGSKTVRRNARKVKVLGERKVAVFKQGTNNLKVARNIALYKSKKGQEGAFFVMNVNKLVKRWWQWKRNLPRIEPFYALKCNDDPVLIKVLSKLGCGFDVASKAEFVKAVKLMTNEKIIYANPIKTKSFIKRARELGIMMMTFDSVEELNKVALLHPKARLILRIATNDSAARCPLSMKFGCDPVEDGPQILKAAAELGVAVVGISFHVGSGCTNPIAFEEAIIQAHALFDKGMELGHKMNVLDIGGGYPGADNEFQCFANIANVIASCIDKYFPDGKGVRIIAEPGRFFATAPFSLVTNIIGVRRVPAQRIAKDGITCGDGFMYYMNDGVYGSFNCILYDHAHPEGRPLFDNDSDECFPCSIWGPTCDGLDQVEKCRMMPQLSTGDWLYYENMGAYTQSAATTFNGFEKARSYYFADENTWKLIADAI